MLEESLKSIKAAEAKAEDVMKEADAKAASVLEEAKEKARAMKEETAQKMRSLSHETMQTVQAEGSRQFDEAVKDARKEIDALKELVISKKPEAVEEVISALV